MSTIEFETVIQDNDFTLSFKSVNTLPNQPTRAQIEDVLTDNGITIPLTKSNNFYVRDANGKGFVVIYSIEEDAYYYEKLNKV